MAKDFSINSKIDINTESAQRSITALIASNEKLLKNNKSLSQSFFKMEATLVSLKTAFAGVTTAVTGLFGLRSLADYAQKVNKQLYDMSRASKLTGISLTELNKGIAKLRDSTYLSRQEATAFFSTVQKGTSGIKLSARAVADLGKLLSNEFGPSLEDVTDAFNKLSSIQQKNVHLFRVLQKSTDDATLRRYTAGLILTNDLSEEQLNVLTRTIRARSDEGRGLTESEKKLIAHQQAMKNLDKAFDDMKLAIGQGLINALQSITPHIQGLLNWIVKITEAWGPEKLGRTIVLLGRIGAAFLAIKAVTRALDIGKSLLGAAATLTSRGRGGTGASGVPSLGGPTPVYITGAAPGALGPLGPGADGGAGGPGMARGLRGYMGRVATRGMRAAPWAIAGLAVEGIGAAGGGALEAGGHKRAGAGLRAATGIGGSALSYGAMGFAVGGPVGAAIGAAGGAIKGIIDNFDDLKTSMKGFGDWISQYLPDSVNNTMRRIGSLFEGPLFGGLTDKQKEMEKQAKAVREALKAGAPANAEQAAMISLKTRARLDPNVKMELERVQMKTRSRLESEAGGNLEKTSAQISLALNKIAEQRLMSTGKYTAEEARTEVAGGGRAGFEAALGAGPEDLRKVLLGMASDPKISDNLRKTLQNGINDIDPTKISNELAARGLEAFARYNKDIEATNTMLDAINMGLSSQAQYMAQYLGDARAANDLLAQQKQNFEAQRDLAQQRLNFASKTLQVELDINNIEASRKTLTAELLQMDKDGVDASDKRRASILQALTAIEKFGAERVKHEKSLIDLGIEQINNTMVMANLMDQEASLMEAQMNLFTEMNLGLGPTLEMQTQLVEKLEQQKMQLEESLDLTRKQLAENPKSVPLQQKLLEIEQKKTAVTSKQVKLTKTLREGYLDAMQTFTNAEGTFSKMVTSRQMGIGEMMRTFGAAGGARVGQLGAGGAQAAIQYGAGGSLQFRGDWNKRNQGYGTFYGNQQMIQPNAARAIQQGGAAQFYGGQDASVFSGGGGGLTAAQAKRVGDLQTALIASPEDKELRKELESLQSSTAAADPLIGAVKDVEKAVRESFGSAAQTKNAEAIAKSTVTHQTKKDDENNKKLVDEMKKGEKTSLGASLSDNATKKENDAKIKSAKQMQDILEAIDKKDLDTWQKTIKETGGTIAKVNTTMAGFAGRGARGVLGTTSARAGETLNLEAEKEEQELLRNRRETVRKQYELMRKGMSAPEALSRAEGKWPGSAPREPARGSASMAPGGPAKDMGFNYYDKESRQWTIQNRWSAFGTYEGRTEGTEIQGPEDYRELMGRRGIMTPGQTGRHGLEIERPEYTKALEAARQVSETSGKYRVSFDQETGKLVKVLKQQIEKQVIAPLEDEGEGPGRLEGVTGQLENVIREQSQKQINAVNDVEKTTQDVIEAYNEGAAHISDSIKQDKPTSPKQEETSEANEWMKSGAEFFWGGLGRQTGGWVPGAGSGDTVPALLEPGEFIMNKRAAAIFAPLLESMNVGKFQAGGWAGLAPSPGLSMASGGGGSPRFNISVRGDTKRAIMNNVNKQLGDILSDMMTATGTTGRYHDLSMA